MGRHTRQDLEALSQDVLALYSRAVELRQLQAAEHLLETLEELARTTPECGDHRDQAYLEIALQREPSS